MTVLYPNLCCNMGRSRKFCLRGSNFDIFFFCFFFLVDEGREDPNTTKSGA